MSRKLLAFLLEELKTVRLICQRPKCGGISELTVEQLASRSDTTVCPACTKALLADDRLPLQQLAKAIKMVQELVEVGSIKIEFVLPDTSGD